MSITRRLLLSILAGVVPAAAVAAPERESRPRMPAFSIPRGVVVQSVTGFTPGTFPGDIPPKGLLRYPTIDLVSTGSELVPLESSEGEAIAREMAVNLRSDGTLRHRQHHWPR